MSRDVISATRSFCQTLETVNQAQTVVDVAGRSMQYVALPWTHTTCEKEQSCLKDHVGCMYLFASLCRL